MRGKSTVGHVGSTSLPSATLLISSSSLMCPASSGVLTGLVGDFLADLT